MTCVVERIIQSEWYSVCVSVCVGFFVSILAVRSSFDSRLEPFDFMDIKVIGIVFMWWLEKKKQERKKVEDKNHPPCRSRNKRYSHHMILSSLSGISLLFFLSFFFYLFPLNTFHRYDCVRLHGSFCAISLWRDHCWAIRMRVPQSKVE